LPLFATEISCNLYNPGGDFTGYWGPFVKGPVKVPFAAGDHGQILAGQQGDFMAFFNIRIGILDDFTLWL
jgi:hypothetical protein